MKKIIYLFLLLGLTFNPLQASSQEKEDYLSSAYALFEKGDYNNAQKALNVYVSVFNGEASDLAYKLQQCLTLKDKAEDAIAKQQIKDAINYYSGILSINSNDPIAKKKIEDLEISAKNEKSKLSPIKRNTSNPIKPINGGLEIRLSSSFDSKGPFGFGVHFNRSYFKLGFDVLFSGEASDLKQDYLDNEYMWDDNIDVLNNQFILLTQKNNYLSDNSSRLWYVQSEYINPITQLTLSPGINLKYFSIECGLGVYICENIAVTEYKIATTGKEPYQGIKKSKSYFTAKPTVSGYIPVSKNHDCLSVSLGYNFVSGAEPLNGFVVGLGLSWNVSK